MGVHVNDLKNYADFGTYAPLGGGKIPVVANPWTANRQGTAVFGKLYHIAV